MRIEMVQLGLTMSRGTSAFRSRHVTRRIVARFGWFTVHRFDPRKKVFTTLENID